MWGADGLCPKEGKKRSVAIVNHFVSSGIGAREGVKDCLKGSEWDYFKQFL